MQENRCGRTSTIIANDSAVTFEFQKFLDAGRVDLKQATYLTSNLQLAKDRFLTQVRRVALVSYLMILTRAKNFDYTLSRTPLHSQIKVSRQGELGANNNVHIQMGRPPQHEIVLEYEVIWHLVDMLLLLGGYHAI